MIAPLAALGLALAGPAWPHTGRAHVTVSGKLEADPRTASTDVPKLDAAETLDGVVRALGLEVEHGSVALERMRARAKPIAEGEGDRLFTLSASVNGRHLSVETRSLHRAADIVGHGESELPTAWSGLDDRLRLAGAWMEATTRAFSDLHEHLDDDTRRPRVHVALRFETRGLEPAEMDAAKKLLDCAAKLAEPVSRKGLEPQPGELGADLEIRLRRFDPDETEGQLVSGYAGRLQIELDARTQAQCSLAPTPLRNKVATVLADPGAHEVRVRFEVPPKPAPELDEPAPDAGSARR